MTVSEMGASAAKAHEVFKVAPTTTAKAVKTSTTSSSSGVGASPSMVSETVSDVEPTCSLCGEPVELADPNDPQSWVHAEHANDTGDHTAEYEPALIPEMPQLVDGLFDEMGAGSNELNTAAAAGAGDGGVAEPQDTGDPGPVVAVSGPVAEVGWDEPLTPVPDTVPAGAPTGVALLAGGADLVESTVTLIAYKPIKTGGEVREVLHATVTTEAEAKLRDALGLSETVMVPVDVTEDQDQPHPYDVANKLYANLTAAMKQINKAIKHGTKVDPSAAATITALSGQLDGATTAAAGDESLHSMLTYYQAALAPYVQAVNTTADDAGAGVVGVKLPKLTEPWTMTVPVTVTKMIPAPPPATPAGILPAQVRDATRLKPTFDPATGTVSWDGKARATASGKEYAIELGDGYQAVYRPYAVASASDATQLTLRGQLEIVAPPGTGHGPELVRRLGQLHLVNRALTGGEGEWTYLQRNIAAQGLTGHPDVTAALHKAQGIEDAQMHILVGQRAHQAAGLTDTQLSRFAAQLTLDAEAAALPDKVRLLRDGVAKATGHLDGDTLAGTSAYRPTPTVERGWLTWSRFDALDKPAVDKAWATRRLAHRITAGNLYNVVTSGVLASTERRQLMGIGGLSTMSPEADKHSGGATSVFLRVQPVNASTGSSMIIWDNPTALVGRADWYAYNGDAFGAAPEKAASYGSGSTYTTNVLKAASHDKSNNEIMFRHGIDLLHGPGAPSRIICANTAERDKIRTELASRGITHIGTRTVGDVVTC